MLKGFATAAICVAILVTIDYEFWGMYSDQALQMLRQMGYSFGL